MGTTKINHLDSSSNSGVNWFRIQKDIILACVILIESFNNYVDLIDVRPEIRLNGITKNNKASTCVDSTILL